jgi:hypothetical protein
MRVDEFPPATFWLRKGDAQDYAYTVIGRGPNMLAIAIPPASTWRRVQDLKEYGWEWSYAAQGPWQPCYKEE